MLLVVVRFRFVSLNPASLPHPFPAASNLFARLLGSPASRGWAKFIR